MTVSITPGGGFKGVSFAASSEPTFNNLLNESSLYLPLNSTLVPARGSSTPTFARATVAGDFDSEGKLNLNIPSGCPRFTGARLVRNYMTSTANPSWTYGAGGNLAIVNNNVLGVDGTMSGHTLTKTAGTSQWASTVSANIGAGKSALVSVWLKGSVGGESCRLSDGWVTGALFTITTDWVRYEYLRTSTDWSNPFTLYLADATGIVYLCQPQVENVSGQADQTASEYVSVGVLSAPFHGAGVDGCKWFSTNKDGSAISPSVLKKYLSEPSRVNNCLWGRDATNAAWTKSNVTAGKTATGLDNVANSASRLTAAANDATLLQLLTAATGTRTTSAWIKRISGSGTVSLTRNGGTNWTDITASLVAGTWVPVALTSDVGANPTVGLKMGTSGDVIDVDCFQDENGSWRTSFIFTTTAAVTRNADVLSYTSAFNVAQGAMACSLNTKSDFNSSDIFAVTGDSSSARLLYFLGSLAKTMARAYDGVNVASVTVSDITGDALRKRASRWGADLRLAGDGVLGASTAFDGSMGVAGTLNIGCGATGLSQLSGNIGEVHIWNTPLTGAQMQQVTT